VQDQRSVTWVLTLDMCQDGHECCGVLLYRSGQGSPSHRESASSAPHVLHPGEPDLHEARAHVATASALQSLCRCPSPDKQKHDPLASLAFVHSFGQSFLY
jgi:hypothetical protein